jgi:perosamine synthetase
LNIRLFKPYLGQDELENVREAFERAWIGLGPKVGEFEEEWNRYLGCCSSVAVNSATAALHLALTAFHFKEGRKVLVPVITFASTATAVLYNRLTPVFVDVDPETITLDLSDLERKRTSDCVAVMAVHFGGHPVAMEQLTDFAGARNLAVIEDCAHCAGGAYGGKKLGTWGNIGCFSFEEKKGMTSGDGGMICSDEAGLIEPLRAYRWVGIDKDTWRRAGGYTDRVNPDARHWYYEISVLGYKYNMNDLAAAIGLAQLKKLDWMNSRRGNHIKRYLKGMEGCRAIRPLLPYDPDKNVYWIFGVRCGRRDDLVLHLKSKGIATGVHYMPLTLHPLFRQFQTACGAAESIWPSFVTLPLFVELTDSQIDYVVDALLEFDKRL